MLASKKDGIRRDVNLVIYVGDVHHKMDVIAEVIRQNSTQNVLCDVVSGLGSIRSLVRC
jgi:hypothetical protein